MGLTQLPVSRAGALKDFKSVTRISNASAVNDYALNSTTWIPVDAVNLSLSLVAAAGDVIEVGFSGRWDSEAIEAYCDAGIIVSSVLQSFVSGGGPADNTHVGVAAWVGVLSRVDLKGGSVLKTLTAGDISAGTVTVRLYFRGHAAGTKTLNARAAIPIHFFAKNLGQVGGWSNPPSPGALKDFKSAVGDRTTSAVTSSTSFVAIPGLGSVALTAAVGDVIEVILTTQPFQTANSSDFSFNFGASTGTLASLGIAVANSNGNVPMAIQYLYTVVAGDLVAGILTVGARFKTTNGANSVTCRNDAEGTPVLIAKNLGVIGGWANFGSTLVTIPIAVGDETTAITTGIAKVTFRMPHAMNLTAVRASLTTVSSSGIPTVDINEGGTTILSTKLTIDASEKTSTTAATAAVISDAVLADDAEITIDIDVAGTGATGLKVYLIGTRP